MKYLFVIYTDIEYKQHLDNFKSQEFYRKICDDPTIEVIEWGTDFHTDYRDLPTKTQEMMKWCSENKEYDYLIKCDDTTFMREDLKDEFVYENVNIFNPELPVSLEKEPIYLPLNRKDKLGEDLFYVTDTVSVLHQDAYKFIEKVAQLGKKYDVIFIDFPAR